MTKRDIKGLETVILAAISKQLKKPDDQLVANAMTSVIIGFLIDVNRIADALEQIGERHET